MRFPCFVRSGLSALPRGVWGFFWESCDIMQAELNMEARNIGPAAAFGVGVCEAFPPREGTGYL